MVLGMRWSAAGSSTRSDLRQRAPATAPLVGSRAGLVIAAGIVSGLIEVIKNALPWLGERVSGAAMAFVITAILYALDGAATGVSTLDAGLGIFMAWLACLTAAMGIKGGSSHVARVMGG